MKKFQKLIFTLCLTLFSLNILLSFSSKKYEDIPCPTRIENDGWPLPDVLPDRYHPE